MPYLYEMHCHTKEVSGCASASVDDLIKYYSPTDYKGIVLTNHMNKYTYKRRGLENIPWNEKIDFYLKPFNDLKEKAKGRFNVLLGMEINFYVSPNDYLVYGITEEFLRSYGDLMALTPGEFSKLCHENNMLFIQAHPFRRELEIEDWNILDGYEVFNGNPHHYSCNEIAEEWAKYHNKSIITSGSDFHEELGTGIGGMYFDKEIKTNEELLEELRLGNYTLKKSLINHLCDE